MSYGQQGGWGGQRPAPKPRPQHGPEHTLDPRLEAILKVTRSINKNYKYPGEEISRDTIMFETDPARTSIAIPKASMIMKNCGYPLDSENYPMLKKLNSEFPDSWYYFVHLGPVVWAKDARFRHIPTYSRYVIDKFGRVLNAYNGLPVTPEKGNYGYKLIGEGSGNNPFYVPKEKLMILSFCPLPEGFIDFTFGNYSHVLEVDTEAGKFQWVPRPKIKVRNNESGQTHVYNNLPEFIECAVKDFELKTLLRPYVQAVHIDGVANVGPYSIKDAEPREEIFALPTSDVEGTNDKADDEFATASPATAEEALADSDFETIDF